MGTALFTVSEELIRGIMKMPDTARITNIAVIEDGGEDSTKTIHFLFAVFDPVIPTGVHGATPTVTRYGHLWAWNIKEDDNS